MLSFFQMLNGYCKVMITGPGKERFLNLCKNKKILIWNLRRKENGYLFCVSFRGYGLLQEISEKSNTQVRIEGKFGLPFFLYRHKKRKIFFIGLFLCALFLYFLSLFVWEIQIIGTKEYTEDQIKTYLTDLGITSGIKKKKMDCARLEEMIREDFENTAWVSCELQGTLLRIHLKESINQKDIIELSDDNDYDIVANKNGIIESIITRNGTPLVKKGMEVNKGDVLISGTISYYNDYDELLESVRLGADGDVYAKTVYQFFDKVSLSYYEKKYTGRSQKHYSLYFLENRFSLPENPLSYENYDVIDESFPLKLNASFYFPISIGVTDYKEYNFEVITYTVEEAKKKAEEKFESFQTELKEDGKEILNQDYYIEIENEECFITGTVEVLESISKIRKIP